MRPIWCTTEAVTVTQAHQRQPRPGGSVPVGVSSRTNPITTGRNMKTSPSIATSPTAGSESGRATSPKRA